MEPGRIREVMEDRVKEVGKYCGQLGRNFDKETIHKFRVSVKRLRSFLRLLRSGSNEPHIKLPGKFKHLYRTAGAIRDAQLELERVRSYGLSLPAYTKKLRIDIEQLKKDWGELYSKNVITKLKKRLSKYILVSLEPHIVHDFFSSRIRETTKCARTKSPSNAQVHEMRKRLKDMVYTSKLVKTEWAAAFKGVKHVPVNKLDRLTSEIGDYNDARLTLEHLRSFSSPHMDIDERRAIHKICSTESKALKTRKKSILANVRDILLPLATMG